MKYKNSIKSIAIGSFDGIHRAHKVLIDQVEATVIIERNGGYLTPGYKRTDHIKKSCFFYLFETIKALEPYEFVNKLVEDFPVLENIVVGYDFHFGKAKGGDTDTLRELFDGSVTVVDEISYEGIPVHSRTIKTYLREGNITMANMLLGRAYCIEGSVIPGQGLGKREFVPTLNLAVEHYQLPQEGVYTTRTKVKDRWYDSVSFLGHRITTDSSFAVETHILDRDIGNISGTVQIEFIAHMRANKKFAGFNALKAQIDHDIETARLIHS